MHDEKVVFTKNEEKEMIEHLKEHPELLEQKQGKDIMQNFFVKNPQERYTTIKHVLNEIIGLNNEILNNVKASLLSYEIAENSIDVAEDILATYGDDGKPLNRSGLDIPKMRKLVVKNATMIIVGLRYVIKKWSDDQEEYPIHKEERQHYIDGAKHVLLDFSTLLIIKFPHSTPYLREFKKKHELK